MSTGYPPSDAVARLLEGWRGEVEARTVYLILAGRVRDPRRAQVIREIADGEARHRERIERRLRELGQPIPDPSSVQIGAWLRLQARAAPVMTVLRHMETAEQVEITDRYRRPTGDAGTDAVLSSIRSEEKAHSRTLATIEATHRRIVAAVVSLVAHFLVGAAKSLFTLRTWWAAGLEMTAAGVIVGGATYALGLLIKVSG
jgi:rubrerythrin